jgi:hypothetical protein
MNLITTKHKSNLHDMATDKNISATSSKFTPKPQKSGCPHMRVTCPKNDVYQFIIYTSLPSMK